MGELLRKVRQRFTRPDGTVLFEQVYSPGELPVSVELPYRRELDGDTETRYVFGERILGKFTEEFSYVDMLGPTQKTPDDARNILAQMVSLWESKAAVDAIKEMARLLAREGWN
jgi:hypothetical protein